MANPTLAAQPRETRGKNACRRIRSEGRVPMNLYGAYQDPVALTVDHHAFRMLLRREGLSSIISLMQGDNETPCVVREIQRDPVTGNYLHIDLLRVDLTQISTFTVEIIGVGTPVGVREGGVLETHVRSIEVRCLPGDLPQSIEVDVTGLAFHSSLTVSDLDLPTGVEAHTDAATVLFSVVAPRSEEEEEEVVSEEEAEPEVMTKKKEEEEEEA